MFDSYKVEIMEYLIRHTKPLVNEWLCMSYEEVLVFPNAWSFVIAMCNYFLFLFLWIPPGPKNCTKLH